MPRFQAGQPESCTLPRMIDGQCRDAALRQGQCHIHHLFLRAVQTVGEQDRRPWAVTGCRRNEVAVQHFAFERNLDDLDLGGEAYGP